MLKTEEGILQNPEATSTINRLHAEICAAQKLIDEKSARLGSLLAQVQKECEQLDIGSAFHSWIRTYTKINYQTAWKYLRRGWYARWRTDLELERQKEMEL